MPFQGPDGCHHSQPERGFGLRAEKPHLKHPSNINQVSYQHQPTTSSNSQPSTSPKDWPNHQPSTPSKPTPWPTPSEISGKKPDVLGRSPVRAAPKWADGWGQRRARPGSGSPTRRRSIQKNHPKKGKVWKPTGMIRVTHWNLDFFFLDCFFSDVEIWGDFSQVLSFQFEFERGRINILELKLERYGKNVEKQPFHSY